MRLTIDRFQGDRAVLRTDAGQELIVPRGELAPNAQEGDAVTASFRTGTDDAGARAQAAKDVLNEILGTNDRGRE